MNEATIQSLGALAIDLERVARWGNNRSAHILQKNNRELGPGETFWKEVFRRDLPEVYLLTLPKELQEQVDLVSALENEKDWTKIMAVCGTAGAILLEAVIVAKEKEFDEQTKR